LKASTAYGRCIESDLSFDALPGTSKTEDSILIQIERVALIEKDPGEAVRPCIAQGRAVHIVSHESYVAVQVDSVFCFELWLSSNRIKCFVLNEVPDAQLRYWILQQILPLFLLLSGTTEFLHGMAVSTSAAENSSHIATMAFLGESFTGKSTLLAYFIGRGHTLVTDDHLALPRQDYTQTIPAIPYYRSYRAPENLGIPAPLYSSAPSRLNRVYLLTPAPAQADPKTERLTGMEAVTALFPLILYSLYNPKTPDFFPLVEDRFRGLADMARRVPIARLHVPRSLERLPEIYDFIHNDSMSDLTA
jgi:hypothetical protein